MDLKRKYWDRFQSSYVRIKLEQYNFVLSIDKWTRRKAVFPDIA